MEPNGQGKPSKTEALKRGSEYLRGLLPEEFRDPSPRISEDAAGVMKFHGSYQQDDRDRRLALKREGQEKAYQFMVRTRIPGGKLTAAQYLAHDHLAREVGNGTIRITTRQEFQLHGVLKHDVATVLRTVNESLLSTLAACGDVARNVTACPAPIRDNVHAQLQADCDAIASHFAPRSSAYYDVWLGGEKVDNPLLPKAGPPRLPTPDDDPVEPLYGKAYLPRKFKTSFTLPDDNCVDVLANDLAFVAVVENDEIVGYNVYVGGGLGTTPSAGKTFPALALEMAYIPRADVLALGESVLKAFRDLGNRSDRKRARLKYVIHDLGMPAFRQAVEGYLGRPMEDARFNPLVEVCDHLGWLDQGDGRLSLGIPVENGRIKDEGTLRLATGLRTFFERYGTPARLTCSQSILLTDIEPAERPEVERWLERHGIASVERVSNVRRWSMACPALPTCGLAVTEAERALPALLDELESVLESLDLASERFTVRMTGCPNGCARPYNADVGLVGRSAAKTAEGGNEPGTYTIFLGGSTLGHRLNVMYKDYVPYDQVVPELAAVLTRFAAEREPGERFGDYCHRLGVAELACALVTQGEPAS